MSISYYNKNKMIFTNIREVIDGINPQENETTEEINQKVKNVLTKILNLPEDEVERELDKCYRLGPARAGKQSTILRFRFHGFKEKVYHKRKTIKGEKNQSKNVPYKAQNKNY